MFNQALKDRVVRHLLPRVQTPAQYVGGEIGAVVKDRRRVRGTLCLAFPDTYAIGMSHHGLQVLYALMNRRPDWACERVFAPLPDMQRLLRQEGVPLYSLETFTPLEEFDLVGFTLQHDLGHTNVLTMLELGGIPLAAEERTLKHPLVMAGGPSVQNPEPVARFFDLFVLGDGEESLPEVCDAWLELRRAGGRPEKGDKSNLCEAPSGPLRGKLDLSPFSGRERSGRRELLAELARRLPYVYVPQLYVSRLDGTGRALPPCPALPGVPEVIRPAAVADLDAVPLPTAPVVPYVECVQDRITIEIMRGCPWRCRFCQSTTVKRPVRTRRVETIVRAALESYRNTGYNEVSLLSLSTSDYPHFDDLVGRLRQALGPLDVSISVPSLRVNRQWRALGEVLTTERRSGLTLAPEAARDDMRRQIGKRITNDDLMEGCRRAFAGGFQRVKLYFMCGLPGERREDLDGIIDMAEEISRLGRQVSGRPATVVANVSNFVPKPQTPFQWNAMQTREYFDAAHRHLRRRLRLRSVKLKYHDLESSLLEGLLCRGDRRLGQVIEAAWRKGARLDAWGDHFRPELWHEAIAEAGIDVDQTLHTPYPADARLPWEHVGAPRTRDELAREHQRSLDALAEMGCGAGAVDNP